MHLSFAPDKKIGTGCSALANEHENFGRREQRKQQTETRIKKDFKMKVIIIEDEEFAARRLERMIYEIDPDIKIVAKLESVSASIEWLQKMAQPDLIFMDIHLEDNSSFAIFHYVEIDCPVVFTTATDEKLTVIFKQNKLDYLLKPICGDELKKIIEKNRHFELQNWKPIDISIFTNN